MYNYFFSFDVSVRILFTPDFFIAICKWSQVSHTLLFKQFVPSQDSAALKQNWETKIDVLMPLYFITFQCISFETTLLILLIYHFCSSPWRCAAITRNGHRMSCHTHNSLWLMGGNSFFFDTHALLPMSGCNPMSGTFFPLLSGLWKTGWRCALQSLRPQPVHWN